MGKSLGLGKMKLGREGGFLEGRGGRGVDRAWWSEVGDGWEGRSGKRRY